MADGWWASDDVRVALHTASTHYKFIRSRNKSIYFPIIAIVIAIICPITIIAAQYRKHIDKSDKSLSPTLTSSV